MFMKRFTFYVILTSSLTSVNCKCYNTECIVLAKRKCPDGYMEQGSKPCLFGIFGHSYLCCETTTGDEATTPTIVTPTTRPATTPNSPTTTTLGTPSLLKCEKAKQSEFPFVVALTRFTNSTTKFCEGCILSPHFVLTSGRCLFDANKMPLVASDIVVTAASLDLQVLEGTEEIVIADQFYIHPDYDVNNITQYANIALLHLSQPFEFNEYVSSISLPPVGFDTKTLSTAETASWKIKDLCASTNESSVLQKVNVPIVDDKTCSQIYNMQVEPKGKIKTDEDSQICTAGNNNYKDCPAASGGFLRCESYVCGIGSVIAPDGSVPNIYTDVAFFRDFVEKTMNTDKNYAFS